MPAYSWVVRLFAVAALLSSLTVSFGTAGAQPRTTITFWHGYSQAEVDAFNTQVIPAFEATHPAIKVNAQATPYDELRRKLIAGVAGGETPDVLRSDIIWVPEFADMGALVPLSDVMPDFQAIATGVFPGPLQTNLWQGKYYGLPLDTNTRVLLYNKSLYRQAGIEAPPTTVDELETDMARVKAVNGDLYGYAEGGPGPWSVLPWVFAFGGDITDPTVTTATGYVNGPGSVAAVTRFKRWLDAGYLSPSVLGGGIGTGDGLGKNLYANILDGPWMKPILSGQFPTLDYDFAPVPAGPSGSSSVVGGEDIVVFDASPQKEAALEFVRFMLSPDTQLEMGKVGQMPVLNALVGDPGLPSYYPVFMQQLQTARPRTPHPKWGKIEQAFSDAVESVLRDQADPQSALDAAADKINQLLQG
jgi:multiple sugar transport system substrate-binding protein